MRFQNTPRNLRPSCAAKQSVSLTARHSSPHSRFEPGLLTAPVFPPLTIIIPENHLKTSKNNDCGLLTTYVQYVNDFWFSLKTTRCCVYLAKALADGYGLLSPTSLSLCKTLVRGIPIDFGSRLCYRCCKAKSLHFYCMRAFPTGMRSH